MGISRVKILHLKQNRTLEGADRLGRAGVRLGGVIDNPELERLQDYGWGDFSKTQAPITDEPLGAKERKR